MDEQRKDFLITTAAAALAAEAAGAPINVPVAVAQAALESAFGRSGLARDANNLFGIKAGSSWDGPTLDLPTREFVDGQWIGTVATWRKYDELVDCFADYGELIARVYPQSAAAKGDPRAYLEGLTSGELKYATDPDYTNKVWSIVERYELLELAEPAPPRRLIVLLDEYQQVVGKVPVPEGAQVRYTADENENGTRFYIRPVLPEGGIE